MTRIFVHDQSGSREAGAIEPGWLLPGSGVTVWVDIAAPTLDDSRVLSDVFRFHELAVEDALSEIHHPKIESYGDYLYLILHRIDFHETQREKRFATHDVDFFLGPNYLVTVHDGHSRSIAAQHAVCLRNHAAMAEGAAALMHRIVDALVDHYRPEADKLEESVDALETRVFEYPRENPLRELVTLKKDIAALRRVTLPQRDAISRLARREFPQIAEPVALRLRDVYDQLVRLADESTMLNDRVQGLVEVYLSSQSNRLNQVMKVMTVIATIFMPLTVLSGLFGMNVLLPHMPGPSWLEFWWIVGLMVAIAGVMLLVFRKARWL